MLAKRSVPDPRPDGRSPIGAPHPRTQAGCKLAFGRFHLSLLKHTAAARSGVAVISAAITLPTPRGHRRRGAPPESAQPATNSRARRPQHGADDDPGDATRYLGRRWRRTRDPGLNHPRGRGLTVHPSPMTRVLFCLKGAARPLLLQRVPRSTRLWARDWADAHANADWRAAGPCESSPDAAVCRCACWL